MYFYLTFYDIFLSIEQNSNKEINEVFFVFLFIEIVLHHCKSHKILKIGFDYERFKY